MLLGATALLLGLRLLPRGLPLPLPLCSLFRPLLLLPLLSMQPQQWIWILIRLPWVLLLFPEPPGQ